MPFGKWKDFDACITDFIAQGKDEESAKEICGALRARLGKEFNGTIREVFQSREQLTRIRPLP
ncbi:MAG: hypothetical protein OEZ24_02070, partial [Candidatus Bathyarchaeota archaeon]|nr:hypothetical protein [Candidatus Bathyarchaeota archaeon]